MYPKRIGGLKSRIDTDQSMAPKNAESMATVIRQRLVESGLNFALDETPFAMRILLRKTFVRDSRLTRDTDQETLIQQPQQAMLEEARAKIMELEHARKLMTNRAACSEERSQKAEARMQELEHYAIETSNSARSLDEQLAKANEQILELSGQLEQEKTATEEKIRGLKSELKTRGDQLKDKNGRIREIEAQMVKSMETTEKQKAESKRKIDTLVAKNSAIQARLDEAKKTIRLEKSQLKSSKRRKEKAVQVNSLKST